MKIKKLQLQNFKRFADLTIDNIPESAKLVLLVGANGSGKSSVFDAFGLCIGLIRAFHVLLWSISGVFEVVLAFD